MEVGRGVSIEVPVVPRGKICVVNVGTTLVIFVVRLGSVDVNLVEITVLIVDGDILLVEIATWVVCSWDLVVWDGELDLKTVLESTVPTVVFKTGDIVEGTRVVTDATRDAGFVDGLV